MTQTTPKIIHETPSIETDVKDGSLSQQETSEHDGIEKERTYQWRIKWRNVFGLAFMHSSFLYAMYLSLFEAKLTFLYAFFMSVLAGLGVTIGAHRFYCHRSFKANKYIRLLLVVVHTIAGQDHMYAWVREHRTHHKYTETDADPHNAKRGFFFSHVGWLMVRRHPDVIKKGKTIDMSDLEQDPIVMFQKKYFYEIFSIVGFMLPLSIPCLLWNETLWNSLFISVIARVVFCWNATWLVNSYAHLNGNKPYTRDIAPGENPRMSLLVLGEGMHNFHHTFPWDYRAAEYTNISTRIINYWIKKGWAYDAKSVPSEVIKRQVMKKGDGSHPVYNKVNPNGVPASENY